MVISTVKSSVRWWLFISVGATVSKLFVIFTSTSTFGGKTCINYLQYCKIQKVEGKCFTSTHLHFFLPSQLTRYTQIIVDNWHIHEYIIVVLPLHYRRTPNKNVPYSVYIATVALLHYRRIPNTDVSYSVYGIAVVRIRRCFVFLVLLILKLNWSKTNLLLKEFRIYPFSSTF